MPRVLAVIPVLVLLLAGCSGGGDPAATPTATPGAGGGVSVGDQGGGPQNPEDEGDPDEPDGDDPVTPQSWAFGPVQLHAVFHAYESSTPVTQTWSGYICGDPFRETWTMTQVIESSGVSNTQIITKPAFAVGEQPLDYGGYLQIEAVSEEPGFRLFLGDSEPEQFEPQEQRIPVEPRWAPEMCS